MFIKKNATLILAFSIVGITGALFFFLFQSENIHLKGDIQSEADNKISGKKLSTTVVKKKQTTGVMGVVINDDVTQKAGVLNVDSPPVEPLYVPLNSLADARLNGDPRTPPIVRSTVEREMPTSEELADPELYQEYETRQNQKVYRSFYSASKNKLAEMEKLMEQARSQGVPDDKLREGDEKIAKMKAMRKKLSQTYDDISDEQ